MRRLTSCLVVVMMSTAAAAQSRTQTPAPVRTVASVDLDRYLGDWFEIARYPNDFQDKCLGNVQASYSKRPDGRLDVVNRCRIQDGSTTEADGVARIVDPATSARLEVRFAPSVLSFLPMVWGDYWILGLADDYSWAVVGTPDREYLWVLSRTSVMAPVAWNSALDVVRANGFALDRLIKTSQATAMASRNELNP